MTGSARTGRNRVDSTDGQRSSGDPIQNGAGHELERRLDELKEAATLAPDAAALLRRSRRRVLVIGPKRSGGGGPA